MKVACILIITMILQVSAKTKAQNISIKVKNADLEKVILNIQKQSDYSFLYDEQLLTIAKPVSIAVTNATITEALNKCLANQEINYVINNRTVTLTPKIQLTTSLKWALPIRIAGSVTDEKNEPLAGVSVRIKNTQIGVVTDKDGRYTLPDIKPDAVLVFSFIGFTTKEVAVNGKNIIDVTLSPSQDKLNEVVVVGYGTQKRLNVTAAIGSAPMKELKDQPVFNVATALEGKIPGVSIKQTSGGPGSNPAIKVRGFGSISAGNSPLLVVDGNIVSSDVYQTLSANDIESMDVLKDASSAAIYGSQGSNGVILITTKHGKVGAPKIDLNYYSGFQQVTKTLDVLNAQQFAEFSKEGANNAYLDNVVGASITDPNSARPASYLRYRYPRGEIAGINFDDPAAVAALQTVDYQDLVFRTAKINNYSLDVSGGNDKVKYLINGGYLQQDGIIITSGISRYNLRANVDVQATSKLKIGLNINPTYRVQHTVNSDGHWADNGVINAALATIPFQPVYDANGNYTTDVPLASQYGWATPTNAVANATEKHRQVEYINLLSNAYAEYSFLDNLKYRISGNANLRTSRTDAFNTSKLPLNGLNPPTAATGSAASDQIGTWLINQTLTYNKSFKSGHNIDVLIGMEANHYQGRSSSEGGNTFPNDVVETLNAAAVPSSATSSIVEDANSSYFARIGYNYLSRYLLNFSIRRDGSSLFGPENRWGTFPAGSVGWNISEEPFAKNINWLSSAKIRVSYGLSGNNSFSTFYPYVSSLGISNYPFNNTLVNGVVPSTLGNIKLSWEKNEQLDIGFEFGILRNRISATADYYNRVTRDLLLAVGVPTLTGYGSSVQNIGRMRNRGLEFGLNTNNLIGAFTWSTNANLSLNRNVVLALGPTGAPIYGDSGVGQTNITVIGQPIGNYYGYRQLGVFKDQNDVNSYPHDPTARPGDVKYEDINHDGKIDANDRTIIGNNQSKFNYGMTNTFAYKGIDLSVAFNGTYGGQILNLSRRFYDNLEGNQNQLAIVLNRWKSPTDPGNGIEPRANEKTTGNNSAVSSRWLESASYLRLQNISLGYQLPERWLRNIKVAKARIYISGENIHTWSKYLNYNPDVSSYEGTPAPGTLQGPLTPGVDYGSYPLYKTFVMGLNLTF